MKKINSLDELKNLSSGKYLSTFIQLNFGLRSSKDISYDDTKDTWEIYNYIDDTSQYLNTKELGEETNIIKALEKGALYSYD